MPQAKRTTYKGINFHSVLETRWSFFWDLLGVPWEYEKAKIDLGSMRYIPDFWLPDHRIWVEVKGDLINDKAGIEMINKAGRLSVVTGIPTILTFRSPLQMRCALFSKRGKMFPGARFTACPTCGKFAVSVRSGEKEHTLCPYCPAPAYDRRTVYNAAQAASRL